MEKHPSFGSLELGHLPKEKKKEKNSRKDKIQLKHEVKTDKNNQKKKKNKSSKFKEAMDGRGEKKKEKPKKKKRLALELDDNFIFTQGPSAYAKPPVKTETLNPQCSNTLKHDEDCKKKIKRKKKVAFDLLPGYIFAKRPKIVSSSQHTPKESILLEKKAVRHNEICSQVTGTRYNQAQTHVNESQCTTEDINSQDLFITQKTFRVSSSEPSSGETSDNAVNSSPQMFTPQNKLHTSAVWIKQHLEGSYKCPQNSHFQHHRTTNEHTQKTVHILLSEEEEEEEWLNKALQNPKKVSFQTQMHLNANLMENKKVLGPAHIMPGMVKAYLGEPLNVNSSLDVAKSMKHNHILSEQSTSCLSVGSTSTQTENFFTTELCSYLNFCQRSRVNVHLEDLKPLDLSLPQRARGELGIFLSVKKLSLPGSNKGNTHKEPNLHPYCYLDMKDVEEESESEPNNVDKTTSSEDEPHCRTGKLERTQVRAVQMRLNESFFFKTKGQGKSPRPESPLMKLNQSREVKSRKVI